MRIRRRTSRVAAAVLLVIGLTTVGLPAAPAAASEGPQSLYVSTASMQNGVKDARDKFTADFGQSVTWDVHMSPNDLCAFGSCVGGTAIFTITAASTNADVVNHAYHQKDSGTFWATKGETYYLHLSVSDPGAVQNTGSILYAGVKYVADANDPVWLDQPVQLKDNANRTVYETTVRDTGTGVQTIKQTTNNNTSVRVESLQRLELTTNTSISFTPDFDQTLTWELTAHPNELPTGYGSDIISIKQQGITDALVNERYGGSKAAGSLAVSKGVTYTLTLNMQYGQSPFDHIGSKLYARVDLHRMADFPAMTSVEVKNLLFADPNSTDAYTQPIRLWFMRADPTRTSFIALSATDGAGHSKSFDPVDTQLNASGGRAGWQVLQGIGQAEHLVMVSNGDPGLRGVLVLANDRLFVVAGLRPGEQRTIDIASALRPGTANVVALAGLGKPGASASVLITHGSAATQSAAGPALRGRHIGLGATALDRASALAAR